MPRRKPAGWPDLMIEKRLSTGAIAYYWAPPTRAKKAGYSVTSEALGTDYGAAKRRCDEILNPHYKAWLNKGLEGEAPSNLRIGSFDWMVSVFKSSPKYTKLPIETRSSYDRVLRLVSQYRLTDQRAIGFLPLAVFTPAGADALFEKLKINPKGGERVRTAVLAMRVCSRAWKIARRAEPRRVPSDNPFEKMGLTYSAKPTKLFQYDDLMKFVAAADAQGHRSIGTAAMIAFFWLQREVDILGRLTWSQYRPADAPDLVRVFHHKTGVPIDMPLLDDDGNDLWPELTTRLDGTEKHGTLIITRDTPDRFRGVRLPWKKRHFLRTVSKIRKLAGIDPAIKFMGLRHGGNTEGGDADLTDAQLRALSGHKTANMTQLYTKRTLQQRREAARKRRDARTKKGQLSE
jgi:integrase